MNALSIMVAVIIICVLLLNIFPLYHYYNIFKPRYETSSAINARKIKHIQNKLTHHNIKVYFPVYINGMENTQNFELVYIKNYNEDTVSIYGGGNGNLTFLATHLFYDKYIQLDMHTYSSLNLSEHQKRLFKSQLIVIEQMIDNKGIERHSPFNSSMICI